MPECTLLEIFKDDDSKDKSYGTHLSLSRVDRRALPAAHNQHTHIGVPRGAKADSREFPTIMSRFQLRRYTECCKYS